MEIQKVYCVKERRCTYNEPYTKRTAINIEGQKILEAKCISCGIKKVVRYDPVKGFWTPKGAWKAKQKTEIFSTGI